MAKNGNGKPLALAKCPTGIQGLDEITNGGLPRGRSTLVCGAAGCGKTLLGIEFIVRGIKTFNEPGVFVAFEETEDELTKNVASLGYDLKDLIRQKKLVVDHIYLERSEYTETGEYDLEGLFIRLGMMIDQVGAKRVVIDSLEALFAGLPNEAILRSELRRLFRWLKERGVTAVITGEQGLNTLTRHGLEEYISDCVIFLDNRVVNQVATRRLRIVKYRGTSHGTNEYPTMIDVEGLSVLPISSLGLSYPVTRERVSSGVMRLDTMLGGKGYYRGSSVLVSGTAGSGKSSLATAFADSTCRAGGRCLYFSFEESPEQIIRNMASIGFDLGAWVKKGLLKFHTVRPSLYGLETHLVTMHNLISSYRPEAVVMDPVTNLTSVGGTDEVRAMMIRMIDFLKNEHITALFTSLTGGGNAYEQSEVGISSLMDTWLLLRMIESANERNRVLYVLKSRGMAHSNQMREFVLSDKGIQLIDVYTGSGIVYTGSARLVQESRDEAEDLAKEQDALRRMEELTQESMMLEAQMQTLRIKLESVKTRLQLAVTREKTRVTNDKNDYDKRARIRKADRSGRE